MIPTFAATIDVRQIAPRERHALVFETFDQLPPGESLLLVNDHDPVPLHYQFQDRSAGQFGWDYLEAGPALWRVQISKTPTQATANSAAGGGTCCSGGSCCG